MQIEQLVIISDLHVGSKFGLLPPKTEIDEETVFRASPLQMKLWEGYWLPFWEDVERETGWECGIHVNGDVLEGANGKNKTTTVTHNHYHQRDLAKEVLAPIREKAQFMTAVTGTEFHVGDSGQDEETIFKDLGARQHTNGRYAPYGRRYRMSNGALIDFKHHGPVSMPKMKTGLAMDSRWQNCVLEAAEANEPYPHLCVRSHGHQYKEAGAGTVLTQTRAFMTPSWQLLTPYGWKVASATDAMPNIGGVLLRVDKGIVRHYPMFKRIQNNVEEMI